MSTQAGKDVIYVDVDDEITAIIDKVRSSNEKIVALVLPKRAAVLQSVVNMKLLKRTTDDVKKQMVLITGEAGLLSLAGSLGVYVAKNLQSKPEIPAVTTGAYAAIEDQEESVSMADGLDRSAPISEHLRRAPASAVQPVASGAFDTGNSPDTVELDNETPGTPIKSSAAGASKLGKPGKFSIPDFNKFRTWGIIGGIALIIIVFLSYMALAVMPKAAISIKTDSIALQESLDLRLSADAKTIDLENNVVPAQMQETIKTATQQGETTGQLDKGTKASGQITITNCSFQPVSLSAGTGFSANGMTFISQSGVTVPVSTFTPGGGGFRCNNNGKATVNVVAQGNGANYNIPAQEYAIASKPENVKAQGSAMEGGTSEIVKVVSQADIDNLKQKIAAADTSAIKKELQQALTAKGLFAIEGSFAIGEPEVSPSVTVGAETPTVTITQKTVYTMMGAKQGDLKKIVENAVKDKIDSEKQQILDYGIAAAEFKLQNKQGSTTLTTMNVTAIAGSDIKDDEIKRQVAGKKSNDAKEIISNYPGVTEVTVDYSPFWVSSIPKKASKITVTVEKPASGHAN